MISIEVVEETAQSLMKKAAIEIPNDYHAGLRKAALEEDGDLSSFVLEAMLENYERFFANTKNSSVEVIKRISIANKIIDEEKTFVDGNEGHQVAIYEVKNGLISSMTFIFSEQVISDAETVVQQQLDAYNARDIDAFMETYAENIQLFNFPNQLIAQGKGPMEAQYKGFFESTPDLHCEIKNRIVIGNKVIDEEYVTVNGTQISAVAIYEVENGKIVKVTFLR